MSCGTGRQRVHVRCAGVLHCGAAAHQSHIWVLRHQLPDQGHFCLQVGCPDIANFNVLAFPLQGAGAASGGGSAGAAACHAAHGN